MKVMKTTLLVLSVCYVFTSHAQKGMTLSSPGKKITFSFRVNKNTPLYNVSFNGKPVIIDSEIGLGFMEGGAFKRNLRAGKATARAGEEKYELYIGKTRWVHDRYNELIIPLEETVAPFRKINIVARAFDDALAFRYEFPEQTGIKTITITDEQTNFRFAADPRMLALLLPHYTTSHEGEYSDLLLSELKEDTLSDMPALFELPGRIYAAITEAALVNHAGMYLSKHNAVLTSKLSPLPGQTAIKVKATLPHKSPWRVIFLSDRPGGMLESNVLTSLNEPSKIADVSWLKPGKTTFPWWNGNVTPDTLNAPGNNFVTSQYYIDFCARNNIEYHSVVEYGLHQWYVDDGTNFQPGPNADVTKPVPGLDMKEICDYARSKGVQVRVWVHWAALYPKLDSAFAIFERWGLRGMMVDFMDRDDQEMVNIQEEMLQKAAKHKLHIQFHGAYKPTGLHRTYPNELTREGTLNYEVNKWGSITPDHDLNIVYTRMVAGSSDYHMGGFRAVPESLFKIQYTRPLMLGTRCHMLAMYVVLESYLGMVCDYPAAYEGEPGFEFVRIVPTTWDETRVLQGELHQYIAIARRKGNEWYIGAINSSTTRQISLSLEFLPAGEFNATIYSDGVDVKTNPNQLSKEERIVRSNDKLLLNLAAGGGAALHIRARNP
jgi:alpha-glucosidase